MAVYKVPQDVEAEDKLIGPFSFRQFIYLIIVAIAGFVAWILAQVFIGLIIIPLPIMIFFGVLALPLRKDQPMEVYLAAVVRFFLKPKSRVWKSEGTINLVEVVAPHTVEEQRYKNLSQDDAQSRFDYLARVMDSRGWSTRGVMSANESVSDIVAAESTQVHDIMDDSTTYAQDLDDRLEQEEVRRRQQAMERMHQVQQQATAIPDLKEEFAQAVPPPPPVRKEPTSSAFTLDNMPVYDPNAPEPVFEGTPEPVFNPYPNSMHQRVISPEGSSQQSYQTAQPAPGAAADEPVDDYAADDTSTVAVSPDILNLANNSDLSISAIAHEAERLQHKQDSEEVVISLR